ncbi:MAG: type IV secretory system conjugative DNA transfer family protein [Bacteroidota bacterium]
MEAATLHFYEWEWRCRGWRIFADPVELEPIFEPFFVHTARFAGSGKYKDDGSKPTLLGKLGSLFQSKEKKASEKQPTDLAYTFQHIHTRLTCFGISLPKGYKVEANSIEELLVMLSGTEAPVSFEIIATHQSIRLQLVCRQPDARLIYSQLKAYFPQAVIQKEEHEIPELYNPNLGAFITEYGPSEEFMRPLRMTSRFDPDPYIGLFGILEHLHENEQAVIQILFQGAVNPWAGSILESVSDGSGQSFFLDAPEMVEMAKEKVSSPLFSVVIRAVGQGANEQESAAVLSRISDGLKKLTRSEGNSLIPLSNGGYQVDAHFDDLEYRQSRRLGMLLNSRELATLVHFPSATVVSSKLERDTQRTKPAPDIALGHTLVLGANIHQGVERLVGISTAQRLRHTHIIGATGTGKSTLLLNLIIQDIKVGNGIAVLDPHGDLIETILTHIPEDRYSDVVLIDPADSEYPIGFNILSAHSEIEKEILSSDLVGVFKRLSTSWGDQMNSVLANAILALLESSTGGTLMDLRRFLIEKPFREQFLKTVNDPAIIYYWQKEYPLLKTNSIGPILTRLDAFLRPKLIRNMVAQKKGLDFEHFLNTKKIVLIKLSQGLIGTDNSYLLGAFMVAKIHQAAMARQAKAITDRTPFFLYIDEFQYFITESMSSILSGARKFNLGLILAHQDMQQLTRYDSELASSVLSNAGTRICFRVGEQDARKLEDGFSFFEAKDLLNLSTGEAIVRVDRPENDFNLTTKQGEDIGGSLANKEQIIQYSRTTYGTPKQEVEHFLLELMGEPATEEKEEKPIPPEVVDKVTPTPPIVSPPTEETDSYIPLDPAQKKAESQHRYLQSLIKRMAESRGYKTLIEEPTPDGSGRVDVSLERNGRRIACEVCVTTSQEWELQNIQKCIAAGYDVVTSISTERKVLENIKRQVTETLSPGHQAKVLYLEPEAFFLYLDSELAKDASTETRFKGYRVKAEFNPVDENAAKSKKDQILMALTKPRKS